MSFIFPLIIYSIMNIMAGMRTSRRYKNHFGTMDGNEGYRYIHISSSSICLMKGICLSNHLITVKLQ